MASYNNLIHTSNSLMFKNTSTAVDTESQTIVLVCSLFIECLVSPLFLLSVPS